MVLLSLLLICIKYTLNFMNGIFVGFKKTLGKEIILFSNHDIICFRLVVILRRVYATWKYVFSTFCYALVAEMR
jgi:hypothetical protein